MPTIIETTAYEFSELSDSAKKKARDWYRERDYDHDLDHCYDDFITCGGVLGIEFDTHQIPLMGGKSRTAPSIYWSGFSSQGDGACFEGTWKLRKESIEEIRAHAPEDKTLHGIAERLWPMLFGAEDNLWASVKHTGRYYHENSVEITMGDGDCDYVENDLIDQASLDQIEEAIRDFCRWMYRQLEAENDYRYSDECVDESIEANEYLFDEDGEHVS